MARSTTTRRGFLETIGSAGAAAAGTLATIESARGYTANDSLTVGCLGTGGRCQGLMKSLAQVPGVRIAAVCDVYDARLKGSRKNWRIPRLSPPSTIARCSTARTSTRS